MPGSEFPSLRASTLKAKLVAVALLVLALAVLAGLFLILWQAPDYAPFYAFAVLATTGAATWLLGRRNNKFRRWRKASAEAWRAEQKRRAWEIANPDAPQAKRRSRLIGLGALGTGILLGIAIGGAALVGDLPLYRYMIVLPAIFIAAGVWMLVTGRQPAPRRRRKR